MNYSSSLKSKRCFRLLDSPATAFLLSPLLVILVILFVYPTSVYGWAFPCGGRQQPRTFGISSKLELLRNQRETISVSHCKLSKGSSNSEESFVNFDSLMEMDIVVYSKKDDVGDSSDADEDKQRTRFLGAVQEDGTICPLSAWSTEPIFGGAYLEFLVDEVHRFPGLLSSQIEIWQQVPERSLSYGSRQVGGGKGPGNPHGEESELLYYVHQDVFKQDEHIKLILNPELEITW